MKTVETNSKTPRIIAMSAKTKAKIPAIIESLKDKELFPDKVESAKKSLSNLKSLPF